MNFFGVAAAVLAVVTFAVANELARRRSISARIGLFCVFALLAIPSVWFAAYYLHALEEHAWFYPLRSWPGSEFLIVFLGCAGGFAASLIPRLLLGLPLFAVVAIAIAPYIKPLIGPL